jgi:hypothetical protein
MARIWADAGRHGSLAEWLCCQLADCSRRLQQSSRPETRDDFLKKGVTLRYSYFDKDKQHIATIDVTPKDCGF